MAEGQAAHPGAGQKHVGGSDFSLDRRDGLHQRLAIADVGHATRNRDSSRSRLGGDGEKRRFIAIDQPQREPLRRQRQARGAADAVGGAREEHHLRLAAISIRLGKKSHERNA